jgi:fatty acid desaturase
MPAESAAETEATVRQESQVVHDAILGRAEVRGLSTRSDAAGAVHMALHLAIVAAAAAVALLGRQQQQRPLDAPYPVAVPPAAMWAAFLLQAFTMAFLFNGEHECVHRTAFHSNVLNDVFAHLLGLLTLRPARHYTYYHYNHHKFTGDAARDPEMHDTFVDLRLDNPASYLAYLSGLPFWADRALTLLRHALLGWVLPREMLFLTERTRRKMLDESRVYVGVYAAAALVVLLGSHDVARLLVGWGWALPTLAAQPFLRFYLVAEHTGCPAGNNMLSNTRTTTTWRWYRWLAWQMPFHAEHHAFPTVPFHRLPALHAALADRAEHTRCDPPGVGGYLGVHGSIVAAFWGSAPPAQKQM